jgi:N4-gp56 family major capsid protein
LDVLKKKLRFMSATEPDIIPKRSGKTIQWFRYSVLPVGTTPSAEGVVGTSLALDTNTVSATVSEYSDFITLSSLLIETAIDPIAENAADILSYRAALSVDTITRIEFDSNAAAEIGTLGGVLAAADFRRCKALLEGIDVLPRDNDEFLGIIHPYCVFDLLSDNTAGGFIEVQKYARPESMITGEVGKVNGVRLVGTTNVKTSGTAPNVLYWTYVVGRGAVGAVDLAGTGPSKIVDPTKQMFKLNVIKGGPSIADPEGKIGSAVSYRFVFVVKTLDSTNLRYKMIKSDVSLV